MINDSLQINRNPNESTTTYFITTKRISLAIFGILLNRGNQQSKTVYLTVISSNILQKDLEQTLDVDQSHICKLFTYTLIVYVINGCLKKNVFGSILRYQQIIWCHLQSR